MRLAWCSLGVAAILVPTAAHAACDVTNFMDRSLGDLSAIQQLAYLSVASEESMQSRTDSFEGAGWYGPIGGEGDYDRVRSNASKKYNSLNFEHASDYRTSWVESSLGDNALEGYRACLQSEPGLHYTVSSLGDGSSMITIDWVPGTIGDMETAPQAFAADNVSNLADIRATLGNQPWGRVARSLEMLVRRQTAGEASSLSIRTGNETRVIYLPPPEVPLPCPSSGEFVSNTYSEPKITIPVEMYGCDVRVTANHTARGRNGWVRVRAAFRNLNGRNEPICGTPVLHQSGNMGAECSSIVRVPLFADFIVAEPANERAATVSDSLRVTYNTQE